MKPGIEVTRTCLPANALCSLHSIVCRDHLLTCQPGKFKAVRGDDISGLNQMITYGTSGIILNIKPAFAFGRAIAHHRVTNMDNAIGPFFEGTDETGRRNDLIPA